MSTDKYTKSSRGKPCQVRVPGICKSAPDNETTVFAHLNKFRVGHKALNIHGADACAECHAWLDHGWTRYDCTKEQRDLIHYEAVFRTQIRMVNDGVLKL